MDNECRYKEVYLMMLESEGFNRLQSMMELILIWIEVVFIDTSAQY